MKRFHFYFRITITLVLVALLTSFISVNKQGVSHDYRDYVLGPASTLSINGETNVNSFCCSSQQQFPKGKVGYEMGKDEATFIFDNTKLKINTQRLDCGLNAMNRDLQKTLQSDKYPYITITLKQASNSEGAKELKNNNWVKFQAVTEITLCKVTRKVNIPVYIKKTSETGFQIKGSTSLEFKDFNLEAPTAMMGLIKVKDNLAISFNLDATLI
ncbi:MAG: YceI family protein [Saprospiraceae bacterium]|nr:YceI family protein [Saprospiraceae bacterium]MCB9326637.1 YceI family protein [Lewinellaceae bacterium]